VTLFGTFSPFPPVMCLIFSIKNNHLRPKFIKRCWQNIVFNALLYFQTRVLPQKAEFKKEKEMFGDTFTITAYIFYSILNGHLNIALKLHSSVSGAVTYPSGKLLLCWFWTWPNFAIHPTLFERATLTLWQSL